MPRPVATWNCERDVWETEMIDLFSGRSDVFSETWPASGTTRAGTAYARPTWAHPTDGSGSSSSPGLLRTPQSAVTEAKPGIKLTGRTPNDPQVGLADQVMSVLPTPRATDGKGPDPLSRQRDGKTRPPSDDDLPTAALRSLLPEGVTPLVEELLLPTPDAYEGTRGGSQHPEKRRAGDHSVSLQDVTEHLLLPTPRASDTNGIGEHGTGGQDLRTTVSLLPTPRATDGTNGGPNQRGSSGDLMLPSAVMTLPGTDGPRPCHSPTGPLLPTPTAQDSTGSRGHQRDGTPYGPTSGTTLTDATERLLPTPRAAADRTSRSAATRRDSRSAPSLGQAAEIAQGLLPREFDSWEELPPSWHHGQQLSIPED